jgi:homoserine kinase
MDRRADLGLATVEVRVAASTSNLGPGFDVLGLALSLYLRARCLGTSAGPSDELAVEGPAAAEWPAGPGNLFLEAFHAAAGGAGAKRLSVETEIPVARGLGSSGAAVAAGLLLGAAVAGDTRPRSAWLARGIEIEGHPDNVAASLYGGLTLCLPGMPPRLVCRDVHPRLAFAVAWPATRLETARARSVLPKSVPFGDAVENARRLPLLLHGLASADEDLVRAGGEDRLHVPYRLELIPGAREALASARDAGAWLATISGSGSGLVAVAPIERAADCAAALAAGLARASASAPGAVASRVLRPALGAPLALPSGTA